MCCEPGTELASFWIQVASTKSCVAGRSTVGLLVIVTPSGAEGFSALLARIVERKVLFQTLAGKRVKYPNGSQKLSHSKSPHLVKEDFFS
jgi:hypothetical protein